MANGTGTSIPTRKVGGGLIIGAPLGVLVVWALKQFGGIEMPAEPAAALGSVLSFIAGYFIPEPPA